MLAAASGAPAIFAEPGAGVCASRSIHLSRLVVTDFRSYERASLSLDGRPAVLTGENGAGKTNLLEAVSLLAPGRGLRGAAYAEIARDGGAGGWAVAATVETALAGHVRILWLTPAMDRLFLEGASERRRFLDRLVIGFDPAHGTRVNAYERALRERNRLLAEERMDDAWLSGLEDQMAAHGVAIAAARVEMLARLRGALDAAGPFSRAGAAPEGAPGTALAAAPPPRIADAYPAPPPAARGRDAGAGRTLEGPHRTDLLVRHMVRDREARACSTGEQKALLIGIVLANARLLAARDVPPLLLLDEIAAHLDEERRRALFDEILGLRLQAFMTGTDPALFEALGADARRLRVERGAVRDLG